MSIADKLKQIADNMPSVYDNGYWAGRYTGEQAEYNRFWDGYQGNGNRENYNYAFYGKGWTDKTFKPKYPFPKIPYYTNTFNNTGIQDFKGILERQGLYLDLEGMDGVEQGCKYLFASSLVTHVGRIKYPQNVTTIEAIFSYCYGLITVDELHLSPDGSTVLKNAFVDCPLLENLTITGVIGQNDFNVRWSKNLSRESLVSIINALSTTESGKTITLSKTAVNNAFVGGSTGDEWLNLIATKSNWAISLG